AEAICEAVRRPRMRFVHPKSAEQQGRLMQHRARDLLLRQQTQVINAMRAHLAELGIVAAQGREGVKQLLALIAAKKDARLPVDARASLIVLAAQTKGTKGFVNLDGLEMVWFEREEQQIVVIDPNLSPMDYLLARMRDPTTEEHVRTRIAIALLP